MGRCWLQGAVTNHLLEGGEVKNLRERLFFKLAEVAEAGGGEGGEREEGGGGGEGREERGGRKGEGGEGGEGEGRGGRRGEEGEGRGERGGRRGEGREERDGGEGRERRGGGSVFWKCPPPPLPILLETGHKEAEKKEERGAANPMGIVCFG